MTVPPAPTRLFALDSTDRRRSGRGFDWRKVAVQRDGRGPLVHALGTVDDVPRLAGVMWALERLRAFDQVVVDATEGDGAGAALADLGVPGLRRRIEVAAASPARRFGALVDGFEAALHELAASAAFVHTADDAAVACGLAAARQRIALLRAGGGGLAGPGADPLLLDRLADLHFARDDAEAQRLAAAAVDRARIHVVGNPLIDAVRRFGRDSVAARAWQRERLAPGTFALAILSGREVSGELADALATLAPGAPVLVDGSRAAASAVAGRRVRPADYVQRLSLQRAARAVVTDSARVAEEAIALGVPCRLLGARPAPLDSPGALAPAIPMWDGRAGERIAEVAMANLVRVRSV